MFARLIPYRSADVDEVVALARTAWTTGDPSRRVELFLHASESGRGLSLVIGENERVRPLIAFAEGGEPEEYRVRLLQVGGLPESGVVPTLLGRVVRSKATELSPQPPSSSAVWARGFLAAGERQVAFAVATEREALEDALPARAVVEDYDEVAYHFFADA